MKNYLFNSNIKISSGFCGGYNNSNNNTRNEYSEACRNMPRNTLDDLARISAKQTTMFMNAMKAFISFDIPD